MWQGIFGHDEVAEHFRATLRRGRLASTYLFVGPSGIGKRRFALALAKAMLCQKADGDPLEPCGSCESCRLFDAGSHPDLELVSLELLPVLLQDKRDFTKLPIDVFIGKQDRRNQEGLCHRISLKPYLGGRKVAIVDDADQLNDASANCLLKTLEEPPPRSLVILIGTSPSKQLPTIRSRSQVVRFQPLAPELVAQILIDSGAVTDEEQAARLAVYSDGSVERASAIADPALWQFRAQLLHDLASAEPNPVRLAKAIQAFVDDAGKDASPRRDRLRTLVSFAEEFYRGLLRSGSSSSTGGDELLQASVAKAASRFTTDRTIESLESCLAVLEQVDRNANLGLVIQRWCENLVACSV